LGVNEIDFRTYTKATT